VSHLFISYRSKESDFALKVAHSLREVGIPIWMDQLSGIRVGDDWIAALQKGLNESSGLIAALSPEYVKSVYCLSELQRAKALNRPIFPLLLKEVPIEDRPLEVERAQYLDFQQWQDEAAYQENITELITVLKGRLDITPDTSKTANSPQQGIVVPPRKTNEKINEVAALARTIQPKSRLAERKVVHLRERLEMTIKKFDAASNQYLSTVDESNKVILQRQMDNFQKEADEIEGEIDKLRE